MSGRRRQHNFNIRLSDEEYEMLRSLAESEGLTASDVVRQIVRKRYAVVFGQRKR